MTDQPTFLRENHCFLDWIEESSEQPSLWENRCKTLPVSPNVCRRNIGLRPCEAPSGDRKTGCRTRTINQAPAPTRHIPKKEPELSRIVTNNGNAGITPRVCGQPHHTTIPSIKSVCGVVLVFGKAALEHRGIERQTFG